MSTLVSDSLGRSWFGSHVRFLDTRNDSVSLSLKSCMFYHWYCSYYARLCTTPHWPVRLLLVSHHTAASGVWLKHSHDNTAKSRIQARMPGCQAVWASTSITAICLFLLVNFGIRLLLGFCLGFVSVCFCCYCLWVFSFAIWNSFFRIHLNNKYVFKR